jgi:hypothetical protein
MKATVLSEGREVILVGDKGIPVAGEVKSFS